MLAWKLQLTVEQIIKEHGLEHDVKLCRTGRHVMGPIPKVYKTGHRCQQCYLEYQRIRSQKFRDKQKLAKVKSE